MEIKVCTKCKRELTVDDFGEGNGKNGLRAECKECRKQRSKQYGQDNKVAIAKKAKQYRQEHLEYFVEYRKQHRQEHAESFKQYYQDNKEIFAKTKKQYYQDNKETITKYNKQYTQEHIEEYRIHGQTRRARKHLLPSTLTIQQWERIKLHFNNSCAYCGKELPLEQEHFIALTKFGEYSHNNIICACKSCNSSKHDKNFFDWYPKQSYYSKQREKRILKYLGYEKGIQQLSIL